VALFAEKLKTGAENECTHRVNRHRAAVLWERHPLLRSISPGGKPSRPHRNAAGIVGPLLRPARKNLSRSAGPTAAYHASTERCRRRHAPRRPYRRGRADFYFAFFPCRKNAGKPLQAAALSTPEKRGCRGSSFCWRCRKLSGTQAYGSPLSTVTSVAVPLRASHQLPFLPWRGWPRALFDLPATGMTDSFRCQGAPGMVVRARHPRLRRTPR